MYVPASPSANRSRRTSSACRFVLGQANKPHALVTGRNVFTGKHLPNRVRLPVPRLQLAPDFFLCVVVIRQGEGLQELQIQFSFAILGQQRRADTS